MDSCFEGYCLHESGIVVQSPLLEVNFYMDFPKYCRTNLCNEVKVMMEKWVMF